MKIIGTGSALPKKVVTNDMLAEFLDTSDEWIVTRTGIKSRHVITDEHLEDLGAEAVLKALEMSGLQPSDIDFFVCSNVISEYVTPGLSCVIAEKVGLTCPMIDINCACPGFVYALDIVETYYQAGKIKTALIVCAEEPTRMASWQDRGTCILFGDGAGAAVLTAGDNMKGTLLHTEPDVYKIWQLQTLVETPFITKQEQNIPMQLKGREVFRFAVNSGTTQISQLLQDLGIALDEVSWILVHQANQRIIDSIVEYLGVPASKFPVNIADHGNTSSASCPILLDECNRKGMFKPGDIVVFSAFGAGLLSATSVMEW
ncbi:MAG: beta-ketoacyl-ACP synthase 3 [Bacteroidales bacterium]|jgi:3-oxoacyl-[acyl-carrier-protein] synthase-3|nr:beta-ketoacyl-ACP synthase 3 [Bacteroidota bacterium]NLO00421.1 beta-ketoacyl-ACP synthase 3 [Bacteroidales bacterium]